MNSNFSASNNIFVSVMGVIAIILSAIALYVGLAARSLQADLKTTVSSLTQRADAADQRIDETAGQIREMLDSNQRQMIAIANEFRAIAARLATPTNRPPTRGVGGPAGPADGGPVNTIAYKVKTGDLLGRIARKFKTTPEAILKANPGLDARKLKVGQTIRVPVPAASARPAAPRPATPQPDEPAGD
jgi:phage tail protein X